MKLTMMPRLRTLSLYFITLLATALFIRNSVVQKGLWVPSPSNPLFAELEGSPLNLSSPSLTVALQLLPSPTNIRVSVIDSPPEDALPVPAIVKPLNGSTFLEPAQITIAVAIESFQGAIAKVEFINGQGTLGEMSSTPYQYTWANVLQGDYTIRAKATDDRGRIAYSSPINLTVGPPVSNLPSAQRMFYVSMSTGSDSNSGLSSDFPWKTLSKVGNSQFQPGDKILLKRGDEWHETLMVSSAGTSTLPIYYGAYGSGNKPKVICSTGKNLPSDWMNDTTTSTGDLWYTTSSNQVSALWRDDVRMTSVKSISDLTDTTKWWWDNLHGRVYVASANNPTTGGHAFEIPVLDTGVRIFEVDHVIVDNLEIQKPNQNGFHLYTESAERNSIVIQNCFIVSGQTGIYESTGGGMFSDILISNNVIIPNYVATAVYGAEAHYGILFWKNVSGFQIMGNTIDGASKDGIQVEDSSSGTIGQNTLGGNQENSIDIKNSHDIVISGNTCSRDLMPAIVVHDDEARNPPSNLTYNITVERNHITGAGQGGQIDSGIFFHYVDDSIIRFNWIENSFGSGIFINDAESSNNNNQIYYNVLVGNGSGHLYQPGIQIGDCVGTKIYNNVVAKQQNNGDGIYVSGGPNTVGIQVINNIVYAVGQYFLRITAQGINGFISDYNCFNLSGGSPFSWNGSNSTFDNWKALSLQDLHSFISDPLFLNVSTYDFDLRSASPCLNRGKDVGLKQDYFGLPVPFGTGVDIGAFEYSSSSLMLSK